MSTTPVEDILNRWPDRTAILEDARAANSSLAAIAVYRWFTRKRIPMAYHGALVEGARRRRIKLSYKELVQAHADQAGHAPDNSQDPANLPVSTTVNKAGAA